MSFKTLLVCLSGLIVIPISTVIGQDQRYQWILNMVSKDAEVRSQSAQKLSETKDRSLVPAMVDSIFYMPRSARSEMLELLESITGDKVGDDYYDWVEYVGRQQNLKSPPGYTRFKAALLSLIDPRYKKFLYAGVPVRIRPEEIVW